MLFEKIIVGLMMTAATAMLCAVAVVVVVDCGRAVGLW